MAYIVMAHIWLWRLHTCCDSITKAQCRPKRVGGIHVAQQRGAVLIIVMAYIAMACVAQQRGPILNIVMAYTVMACVAQQRGPVLNIGMACIVMACVARKGAPYSL